jgi:IS5 family transposase
VAGCASGAALPGGRRTCAARGSRRPDGKACRRCALLKQYRQLSYEELALHLEGSASFRAFARLPWPSSPKKSVLQRTISAIRAETWEEINRTLLSGACREKLEDGSIARLDSTVTAARSTNRASLPSEHRLRRPIAHAPASRCTVDSPAKHRQALEKQAFVDGH